MREGEAGGAARLPGFFAVLRLANYGVYTAGNSVSLIGTWVQRIATGWLTWELTGSGVWLGIMAFADLFPTVLVGPVAGAIADRTDRLRLTYASQSAACGLAVLLFVLSATGLIEIYSLLVLTLATGIVMALNQPARMALISSLVPRSHLPAAVAVNSIVFNVARFVGPAVAGVLIVTSGVAAAFAFNALSFAVFLFALSRVRLDPEEPRPERSATLVRELVAGYRYAATHAGLGAVFVLLIMTSIGARPVVELLPGFADAVFGAGATGLAILTSSIGIGSIIAGLWLGGRPNPERMPLVVVYSAGLLSCAILLFVATDLLWVAIPAMILSGFAMAGTGIGSQTMIHLAVEPAMRGRVLSIHGVIFRGGPALGALAMGAASEFLGLRIPLAIGAVLVLSGVGWMWLRLGTVTAALLPYWRE
ncbi:MFS transporter [Roseitranquillus sediminis]|uniref:MFS transporter n=1 Tax=Roseitranquillus sediminis TaxID=2809051 RepID=UPI001D0C8891|nr:MFS transporter [Roseitranquillus sediminis]MBM9594711.1 MFS transporter [Roseitranquillus sediminis]